MKPTKGLKISYGSSSKAYVYSVTNGIIEIRYENNNYCNRIEKEEWDKHIKTEFIIKR